MGLGCLGNLSKDNSKYVSLTIFSGGLIKDSGDDFDKYKSNYNRYDENLYLWMNNDESTLEDGKSVSVKITDYEVYQPTKYIIKVSGHIRFDGDSTIKSIHQNLDMTVRDGTGKIIGENGVYEFEIENHQTTAFTTQATLKVDE